MMHGVKLGFFSSVWLALALSAVAPNVDAAGIPCSVPRSRQILSGFGPSRMASLFRARRGSRFGSAQSQARRAHLGNPRFGSIRFGASRFGRSTAFGLAGGRLSAAFNASHRRLASRQFFSSFPRCHFVHGP